MVVSIVLVVGVVFKVFGVVLLLLTTSIPHHTLNYGTSDDGDISDIGWLVMVVVVMVRYLRCW